ncbi:MAG: ATP-binding protein, partial [Candidatus Firestonebacteria bacterium]
AEEMKLTLCVETAPNLPRVYADGNKLKQIVTNLMSNAMKFTPPGGKVSVIANTVENGFVVAGVRDTGIGIPADKLASVFDKFTQVKEAQQLSKKIKGTGLGLNIAKNIVELHGGKIWVESKEEQGTTFFFTIPANKTTEAAPENNMRV